MTEEYTELSYVEAANLALKEEMAKDRNVVLIGEDIADFKSNGALGKVNDNQIWSSPISENSFTGMGIGAAITGLRPVINLGIGSFLYLASDQIYNQASKLHLMTGGQIHVPIVIRLTMLHKSSNAAQHSDRPYSMCMNMPGLKVLVPATPGDMKGLLKAAIRDDDPVLIFESFDLLHQKEKVPNDSEYIVPIGKADIKRKGDDITVVSVADCLNISLSAATQLEKENISVEVIDLRSLSPLDTETIFSSVRKTGRLIIVDNANRSNSAASEISAIVSENLFGILKSPVERITTPNVHIPFSPPLEKKIYPDAEKIVRSAHKII